MNKKVCIEILYKLIMYINIVIIHNTFIACPNMFPVMIQVYSKQ